MPRRSGAATALLATFALMGTGCTTQSGPTYAEVRAQAESAVAEITATLPRDAAYAAAGDAQQTSCEGTASEPSGPEGTAFATIHGVVTLPAGTDPASLIEELPVALGKGWAIEPVGIDVELAAARLNQASTSVSVDITQTEIDGVPGLDILAVSACGRAD